MAINEIAVSATPLDSSSSKPNWASNPLTLLGQADASLFTIDSLTPFLWLPEKVCDQFANALGLEYDEQLRLYTFGRSTSQHGTLTGWNMSFTFKVADVVGLTKSIDIRLPYGAFDLQLSFPFPGLNITAGSAGYNYFPLRRAVDTSQYTIGRPFLQEAYLIIDYDRKNFSLSQAKFATDALDNVNLVSITRPKNGTNPAGAQQSPGSSKGAHALSKAAIAGIAVGAVIGISAIAGLLIFCIGRHRHGEESDALARLEPNAAQLDCFTPGHGIEVSAEQEILELPGTPPPELSGNSLVELPGSTPRRRR